MSKADIKHAIEYGLAWIDSIPSHIHLPSMPGFDRDYLESALDRLSSAQCSNDDIQICADAVGWIDDWVKAVPVDVKLMLPEFSVNDSLEELSAKKDNIQPLQALLTDQQCEEFRRVPGSFQHMVRTIYFAGMRAERASLIEELRGVPIASTDSQEQLAQWMAILESRATVAV